MRKLIVIIAAGALLLAACGESSSPVQAADNGDPGEGISVVGEGRVTGAPDTMTVTVGVSVLRDTVAEATADAAAAADRIIAALETAGIADEDLSTANYSIWPEWDYREDSRRVIGYRVENTVLAKVRDLEAAGEVIDAAVAAGGDDAVVNGLSFSIEDNQALVEQARAAAWDDAETKARQLADLAGVQLGSVVSISESYSSPPTPVSYERAVAADEAGTPILPGVQEVSVSLQVTFAMS